MNILFLTKEFGIGGLEIVTATLANKFHSEGHNVVIWSFSKENNDSKARLLENIKVKNGNGVRISSHNVKALRKVLLKYKIDVVINQWGLPFTFTYMLNKSAKGIRLRTIAVYHNDPSKNSRTQGVDIDIAKTNNDIKIFLLKIKRHIYKAVTSASMRYVYKHSDSYILLSRSYIEEFKKFTGISNTSKLSIITNPITIDTTNFVFDVSKKGKDVIYVGRLDPNQKRVRRVLEAWALIENRHPNWTLRIIGEGEERKELERMIVHYPLRSVRLEGVNYPRRFYEKASFLLLTSEYEGFPLVLAECMSFGVVPIVLGSYSAVHDIIEDGKDGYIIPYSKQKGFVAKDMADKLEYLMNNKEKRNVMAIAAIEKSKKFSIEKIYNNWMEVLSGNESIIPHKLHFCWLGGGKMNHILSRCVKTFPRIGDVEITCWNNDSILDVKNAYVRNMIAQKKWAFVSDYIRLKVLYEHGGIYLDTDVQVCKRIPNEFFNANMVLGYAYDDIVSTAFIMVKPHHPFIKYLLDKMDVFNENDIVVNNGFVTNALLEYYPDFVLDGNYQEFAPKNYIYPRYFFDSATYKKEGGYTIHHGVGSWSKPKWLILCWLRPYVKLLRFYVKPFGAWYQERVNKKMVARSGRFLEIYKKNNKGII